MTANETPRWNGAIDESAGRLICIDSPTITATKRENTRRATIREVLNGQRHPHELGDERHDLYRLGFRDGCDRMQETVYRLEAERDRLWYQLNNSDEARARHAEMLKAFDVARARKTEAERWAELDRIAAARAEAARA